MKETISLKQILYANLIGFIVIITSTIFLNTAMAGSQNKIIEGHSFLSNIFWVNITFMGDAIFAFAIIFLLLFFSSNKDLSLKLLLNLLFILIIVQFVKNIFSTQPIQLYFEAGNYLDQNGTFINNNIISSHTAIAFMLSLFL